MGRGGLITLKYEDDNLEYYKITSPIRTSSYLLRVIWVNGRGVGSGNLDNKFDISSSYKIYDPHDFSRYILSRTMYVFLYLFISPCPPLQITPCRYFSSKNFDFIVNFFWYVNYSTGISATQINNEASRLSRKFVPRKSPFWRRGIKSRERERESARQKTTKPKQDPRRPGSWLNIWRKMLRINGWVHVVRNARVCNTNVRTWLNIFFLGAKKKIIIIPT